MLSRGPVNRKRSPAPFTKEAIHRRSALLRRLAALGAFAAATGASAAPVELTTNAGLQKTCAALNVVLAYDMAGPDFNGIALVDRDRIRKVAYGNVREGIRQSKKLREALLAETDDDCEWIASPRQVKTSFPLAMDAQTFTG